MNVMSFVCGLWCRKTDLVVAAPFYHAPGVSGAIYVYYNSEVVCNSLVVINRLLT